MSDRDHIKTLYDLLDAERRLHNQVLAERDVEIIRLRRKNNIDEIFTRLRINKNIFEAYDSFVSEIFEDLSGNAIDQKTLLITYKEWSRFNPNYKSMSRDLFMALLTMSPIENKRIKEQ